MKKLRSINGLYVLGTLPFTLAITIMSYMLVIKRWQRAAVILAGGAIMLWIIKKGWCLPRAEQDYEDLTPFELELPGGFLVIPCLCPAMDRYSFLRRNVEIISPLLKPPGEPFRIAVSPECLKREGKAFLRIAVMREVVRYRQAVQAKAVLGLVTPVLVLITILEGYFVLGWNEVYPIDPGYLRFFGPLMIAAAMITLVLVWNKKITGMDYRADDELKQYFSGEEICAYIKRWDEMNLPDEPELINEKSRQLELFYLNQRLERL